MVEIGRINRLRIVKEVDFGLYLDGGDPEQGGFGEILLPARFVPPACCVNDEIAVFIYFDSEDRIIATTARPYAMVGEFVQLLVTSVSHYGAFLEWGLSKDLLLPFGEQIMPIQEGESHIVCLFLDEKSQRITASAKLNDFLHDESHGDFEVGDEVTLLTAAKTDLGHKMIVNNSHWGLLHRHEQVHELNIGQHLTGYIKQIRDDGRIDLCLHRLPSEKSDEVADTIMAALEKAGGTLTLTDKSSPAAIKATFGVSKALYKKAVGSLYRKRKIRIDSNSIRLNSDGK
ncbi:MAG: S1-like domain-containing RNA-binding protein [Mariprofundales bacterium]|nr:S1-like domain-containing RNA-binding protein [Mariprofundales bacterium]